MQKGGTHRSDYYVADVRVFKALRPQFGVNSDPPR